MKIFWIVGLWSLIAFPFPAFAYNNGIRGLDGQSGFSGTSGSRGRDIEIRADGTSKSFVLTGDAGAPGGDGSDGDDASSCWYTRSFSDVDQAPGGDGGIGGNGGNGGRGGDATIVYDGLSQLRRIQIVAYGGIGARGGRGGRGGRGCGCDESSWSHWECQDGNNGYHWVTTPGLQDHNCRQVRFECDPGRDGEDGAPGSSGSDGRIGEVTLVQSSKTVTGDTPAFSGTLGDLAKAGRAGIALSKNLWFHRRGMQQLLAPGSVVSDEYTEFDRQIGARFALDWRAKESIDSVAQTAVSAELLADGSVSSSIDPAAWIKSHLEEPASGAPRLVVDQVYGIDEALVLSVQSLQAVGRHEPEVILDIKNAGPQAGPIPYTRVHIKALHKTLFWWKTVVDADVSPDYGSDGAKHEFRFSLKHTLFPRHKLKVSITIDYALRGEKRSIVIPERLIPIAKD